MHALVCSTAKDQNCSKQVKYYWELQEVDLAMVADMGTLQRLPSIVGDGEAFPSLYQNRNANGPIFTSNPVFMYLTTGLVIMIS